MHDIMAVAALNVSISVVPEPFSSHIVNPRNVVLSTQSQ